MNTKKRLYCYYPGKKFPAVSVTGTKCQLDCGHCGSHYLESMMPAVAPDQLISLCSKLWNDGANGVLISGGCDRTGRIKFDKFYESFARIKSDTGLILNLHTGLLNNEDISNITKSGIDVVSFDLVGDRSVIQNIYHLDHNPDDYGNCMKELMNAGLTVVPHICIGLNENSVEGELYSIDMLKPLKPTRLIFIIFTPTKGTKMEHAPLPSIESVTEVFQTARKQLPETELILGCMRPRRPERYELTAIEAGIDGIVLPSSKIIKELQSQNWTLIKSEQCCAI